MLNFSDTILNNISSYCDKYLIKFIRIIVVTFFAFFVVIRLAGIFAIGPDTWGTIENNVIYSIQRMLANYPLYQDPELPPFSITQYSPIYYHIIYFFCRLADIGSSDIIAIYQVSRTVSLFFNFIFAGLVGITAWRFFKIEKINSLLIGMLSFMVLQPHGYSRPDSLFNVSIIACLFAYLFYLEKLPGSKKTWPTLIITGGLISLSIFSKQSGIVLLAIIFFYQIIILNRFKEAIIIALSAALTGTILFFLFTGPDPLLFYKNAIRGLDNGISLDWFWYNIILGFFCSVYGVVFTVSIVYSIICLLSDKENKHRFWGWSMLILFSFATATGMKDGSTPSYYTEVCAISLIPLVLYNWYLKLPSVVIILIIFFSVNSYIMNPKILVPINKLERYSTKIFESEKEIFDYVQNNLPLQKGEYVFINENGWNTYLTELFNSNGIFPNKDIISQKQTFSYDYFNDLFSKGKIKLLITKSDKNEYLGIKFDAYKLHKEMNGYKIYIAP